MALIKVYGKKTDRTNTRNNKKEKADSNPRYKKTPQSLIPHIITLTCTAPEKSQLKKNIQIRKETKLDKYREK